MKRKSRSIVVALLCLVVAVATGLRAEISVHGDSPPVATLLAAPIIDDPNPIGPISQPGPDTLQGSGGRPDIFITPVTGAPLVVWAEEAGVDHDIAFASWSGSGWSATEFLTTGTAEDQDPRIFREPDGTIHVAWWRVGVNDEVWLTRRAPGAAWQPPVVVSEVIEAARRPSVAVVAGEVWVAYERDSVEPGMAQDLIQARIDAVGGITRELIASTPRPDRLDVVLHSTPGNVWADWKQSATEFGCSEYRAASWSIITTEPWTDPTWVGIEEVRKTLQRHIQNP